MPELTEDEILQKVKEFRADGISGSGDFYERMQKGEDFVIGEQWPAGVKEAARLKGKFTLTIPIVKPQIKQIAGDEIQNPQDFIIENTKGGTAVVAQILTALTKQAADSERIRYEKSQTFESGLGSGQGVIGIFIDKTDDPKHANLRIEKLNEHYCMVDPNCGSYNPNKKGTGAKYMIYEEPVDKEELEAEYPDKKPDLAARGGVSILGMIMGNVAGIIDGLTGRRSSRETSSFGRTHGDEDVLSKSRYLKNHTWWREPKKCVWWYDDRETEIDAKFLTDDKEIAAAKKSAKDYPDIFSVEEVDTFVMHHTIRVKDTFLEDRVDELGGVQMYPLCFYWPYWTNGYKSGIAEDLIGTQEEINWTHSMALNLLKLTANKGWRIKSDPSGTKKDWLKDHGGEDGIVLAEDEFGGSVEALEGPNFAHAQYEAFTLQAMNNVKTISGRLDLPERDPKALSGKAKFYDIQKSKQGSMSIMLNWNYTLAIMGDLIVDIIRKNDIFSEDEIREIVDAEDLIDEKILDLAKGIVLNQIQQMGGRVLQKPESLNPIRVRNAEPELQAQMLDAYQRDMMLYEQFVNQVEADAKPIAEEIILGLIHSMKSGKYSTKVVTSPMAETMQAINALELFETHKVLVEGGDVGFDGEDLIEATGIHNKEKLIEGRRKKLETLRSAVG